MPLHRNKSGPKGQSIRRSAGRSLRSLCIVLLLTLACAMLSACREAAAPEAEPASVPAVQTPQTILFSTVEANGNPTHTAPAAPTATPAPTPDPTPQTATVGAVGDIMAMRVQIATAYVEESERYDFTQSLIGMESLFQSVDVMCANLETPLAGADAGYAKKFGSGERPTFNAPDALAANLQALGVDVLTLANNHALDRGLDGLLRTLETLDALGISRAGAFLSQTERDASTVLTVNGIRIGILAATYGVNGFSASDTEMRAHLSLLPERESLLLDIAACKNAGAEFIICFPHWDRELTSDTGDETRETARWLLENGVDCILGAHPHVVQGMEWMQVARTDGAYTGLVVYSLGNCIGNMAQKNTDYGLFVRLTLSRDERGRIVLDGAEYVPTMYFTSKTKAGLTLHQVVPAYENAAFDARVVNIPSNFAARIEKARKHVLSVCGDAIIPPAA